MSNNMDNERSITTNKMYPIDLAPQKITIVKSMSNAEVKMAHLIPGPPKTTGPGQIMTHATAGTGLMRSSLAQIISPSVASQPQMIISGSPILQGTQIVSQGSQLIGQNTQIISQSQLITPSGQIISPATQIISQGTQLSAPVSNSNNNSINVQATVASSVTGTQVLNVSGQLVTGAGNLVRTLPPTVRVLPPLPHHNTRPAVQLTSVNVSSAGGVLVSKSVGVSSHVPRGLAAGASLAVRPAAPAPSAPAPATQGAWTSGGRGARGGVVYSPRAAPLAAAHAVTHNASHNTSHNTSHTVSHSTILTLPTTSVLNSSSVISGSVRGVSPRAPAAAASSAPRPLPLLQRNYQPAKVVGVASVGVRGVVGNSAPAQLYYEVPRNTPVPSPSPQAATPAGPTHNLSHMGSGPGSTVGAGTVGPTSLAHALATHSHRPLAPYAHTQPHSATQVSIVNAGTTLSENRQLSAAVNAVVSAAAVLPRPSILRKRDLDGSPTKPIITIPANSYTCSEATGWEDVPSGGGRGGGEGGGSGSTTISASSSPAPDDEPDPPPLDADLSPRKKPRKQLLTSEVRHCEYLPEDPPPTPPPVAIKTPKRPLLSSSYVCGWRSTALHFVRPADVRRREPRARDILAIAAQRHVLTSAEGWKVHHLTAQMDDLMSLESDVGGQLAGLLRALETASGRALAALQPHSHTVLELLKGNIQRSKIVCEGVQEAREDILRVFTHRNFVSDILTRQADKRCFRKHRSQS